MDDILSSTSRDVEQVTIEPTGEWSDNGGRTSTSRRDQPTPDDEDDDDIVELQGARTASVKHDPPRPRPYVQTPPISSREPSLASSAARSSKRPAGEVIDLTLSDDEDAPPAKVKRPSVSGGDNVRMRAGLHDGVSFNLPRPAPPYHGHDYFHTSL